MVTSLQEEGMVAGFSLRAILGYLNTDDINGLQGWGNESLEDSKN